MRLLKNIPLVVLLSMMATASACGGAERKSGVSADKECQTADEKIALPEDAVRFEYDGHLTFDVVVRDSVVAKMLFDTGNTTLLFDKEFYTEHFGSLGTQRRAMVSGAGGDGHEAASMDASGWHYAVGSYNMEERMATIIDLRRIVGEQIDGIFGMAFMRHKVAEFNYEKEYIRLLGDNYSAEEYTLVQCKWLDRSQTRMLMPMRVEVAEGVIVEGDFLVDTGSGGRVDFCSHLLLNEKVGNMRKTVYDVGGIGGGSVEYFFTAPRVEVAGLALHNKLLSWSENQTGAFASKLYQGIVGNGFFEHFDVIFDFVDCRIWLRPNTAYSDTAPMYGTGLSLVYNDGEFVVNGLDEDGNAAEAGLRRGDKIVEINGIKAADISRKQLRRMSREAKAMTLKVVAQGVEREITFEKERY